MSEFMHMVIGVSGVWLLFHALSLKTDYAIAHIIYRVVPCLLGICLIVYTLFAYNVIK